MKTKLFLTQLKFDLSLAKVFSPESILSLGWFHFLMSEKIGPPNFTKALKTFSQWHDVPKAKKTDVYLYLVHSGEIIFIQFSFNFTSIFPHNLVLSQCLVLAPKIMILPRTRVCQEYSYPKCYWVQNKWVSYTISSSTMLWDLTWDNLQTPSRHRPNTFQTTSRHPPDTFQTPFRHISGIFQPSSRHLFDTILTPSLHP